MSDNQASLGVQSHEGTTKNYLGVFAGRVRKVHYEIYKCDIALFDGGELLKVPLVSQMAGTAWGLAHYPRAGDLCIVAYLHGDEDHAVILGFLFEGFNSITRDNDERQVYFQPDEGESHMAYDQTRGWAFVGAKNDIRFGTRHYYRACWQLQPGYTCVNPFVHPCVCKTRIRERRKDILQTLLALDHDNSTIGGWAMNGIRIKAGGEKTTKETIVCVATAGRKPPPDLVPASETDNGLFTAPTGTVLPNPDSDSAKTDTEIEDGDGPEPTTTDGEGRIIIQSRRTLFLFGGSDQSGSKGNGKSLGDTFVGATRDAHLSAYEDVHVRGRRRLRLTAGEYGFVRHGGWFTIFNVSSDQTRFGVFEDDEYKDPDKADAERDNNAKRCKTTEDIRKKVEDPDDSFETAQPGDRGIAFVCDGAGTIARSTRFGSIVDDAKAGLISQTGLGITQFALTSFRAEAIANAALVGRVSATVQSNVVANILAPLVNIGASPDFAIPMLPVPVVIRIPLNGGKTITTSTMDRPEDPYETIQSVPDDEGEREESGTRILFAYTSTTYPGAAPGTFLYLLNTNALAKINLIQADLAALYAAYATHVHGGVVSGGADTDAPGSTPSMSSTPLVVLEDTTVSLKAN